MWPLRSAALLTLCVLLACDSTPVWIPLARVAPSARSVPDRERGRVVAHKLSGEGIRVAAGETVELRVDVPAQSVLRFAIPTESSGTDRAGSRVRANGAVVFDGGASSRRGGSAVWHSVALPAGETTLAFESLGSAGESSFLSPVIGPAEIGTYGARPWNEVRPDIVVFLADTFRADNLEAYGGSPGLAPNLDRLARRARVFSRAWSVGTSTLAAHASLFAGVFPRQAGVDGRGGPVPEALRTIAEVLTERGYRTGAITDSVVVSQRFGLDQGFAFFDENADARAAAAFAATLARAREFLDADDGRPLFLFLHTYRVHAPYRVSAPTRRARKIRGDLRDLTREIERLGAAAATAANRQRTARLVHEIRAHYRGGVADLDRELPAILGELRARGILPGGFFIFTSDHGEAFGEHGALYHAGRVYEEQTRVPLLIVGPGISPAVDDRIASLIDLPRTLAQISGAAPDAQWAGHSLFEVPDERSAFAFETDAPPEDATLMLAAGSYKVIGFEDDAKRRAGQLLGAFDLERDPGERENLADAGLAWSADLADRLAAETDALVEPRASAEPSRLDPEKREELRALGYEFD